MIIVPKRNLYLPERKWGQKRFQRGIICATAVYGDSETWVVTVSGEPISDIQFGSDAEVGLRFNSDGTVDKNVAGIYSQIDASTDWIIPNGDASATFSVKLTATGGNPTSGPALSTYHDLDVTRTWVLITGGFVNATWTAYISADGGTSDEDTGTFTMEAERLPSDIRLKSDINYIGSIFGVNLYTWNWNSLAVSLGITSPTIGVIAQEIERTHPKAVSVHEDGYKVVNYRKLIGEV